MNKFWFLLSFLFVFTVLPLVADDENNPTPSPYKEENPDTSHFFSLSMDIKTRHTWRGGLTVKALNFQPTFKLNFKHMSVGAWSVYAVDNSYAEIDLYVSFHFLKYFSFSVYDYYCPDENLKFNRFFDYKSNLSPHTIDLYLSFNGTPDLPLNLLVSTMVHGKDFKTDSTTRRYSTYVEASYTFTLANTDELNAFAGLTPFESYYAPEFNFVNVGLKYTKKVNFFKSIETPVYGKLILNPYSENLFFVFGISI